MTRELIEHYLDEDNWKLSEEQLTTLTELSGDLASRNCSFSEDTVIDILGDDAAFIKELGFDNVKNELFVRSVLDGMVEDEFFGANR